MKKDYNFIFENFLSQNYLIVEFGCILSSKSAAFQRSIRMSFIVLDLS